MYGGAYYGQAYGGGSPIGEEGEIIFDKTEVLVDNFESASIDPAKWEPFEQGSVQVGQDDGLLKFSLPSTADDQDYANISSINNYTLADSYISVHVVEVPNDDTNANATLIFVMSSQEWLRWVYEGGVMYAQYAVGGFRNTVGSVTYNPETMVHWRIRESGGVVFYETSVDSLVWTIRFSFAWTVIFSALNGRVEIEAFTWLDETDPGNYHVESFNIFQQTQIAPPVSLQGAADMTVTSPTVNVAVTNPLPRTYEYKVFDKNGNFMGIWPDVISDFSYSQELNTAGSVIQVRLGRSIDTPFNDPVRLLTEDEEYIQTEAGEFLQGDFSSPNRVGEGTDVATNNRVEVWEYYGSIDPLLTSDTLEEILTSDTDEPISVQFGTPNGRRCFYGIIMEFEADYGVNDDVMVTIASFGVQLDNYVLREGETTTVPFFSKDPAAMVRSGLDNLQAQGGEMGHTQKTIRDTGNVATYTFRLNTMLEVAKKGVELSPEDWSWYGAVDDPLLYMQPRPASVAHRFILGEHIIKGKFRRSIMQLKNLYYFVGGDKNDDIDNPDYLYRKFFDQQSIDDNGQWLERRTDQRVTNETSASLLGNSFINTKKNPRYAGTIDVTAATYPIETIRLGQLAGFGNHGNFIDFLTLIIASVRYNPDFVTLDLELLPPKVPKRIEDIRRNLNTQEQLNTPDTPS